MLTRYNVRIKIAGKSLDTVRLWASKVDVDLLRAIQFFVPEMTVGRLDHMVKHIETGDFSAAHVAYGENDVGVPSKEVWLQNTRKE